MALGTAARGEPPVEAPLSTWTTQDGEVFRARYESQTGSQVRLRSETGDPLAVWLQDLTAGDRRHLEALREGADPSLAPASVPPQDRIWPETVRVDSRAVDVAVVEGETSKMPPFRYRTRSFEFEAEETLSLGVMREIARTFEATRTLVEALPWGIHPEPPEDPGFYRARLFASRESYVADGAPERSSGVYSRLDRIFRVPFQSLGMERRGRTWFMQREYSNDTVIHELTHQFMHDQLPFLTTAIVEGTAEYARMLPYKAGVFQTGRHRSALKDVVDAARRRGGVRPDDLGALYDLLVLPREQWAEISFGSENEADPAAQFRLYFGALLIVYYFSHLDSADNGAPLLVYLDKINEAARVWKTFLNQPHVRMVPGGRLAIPEGIAPPEFPYDETHGLTHMDLLLRGRAAGQLQNDIVAAYRAIGIAWN